MVKSPENRPTTIAPAGYSGTPLPKKLGIKPGMTVALVNAPADFESTLGALPEGVSLRKKTGKSQDLIIWFIRNRAALQRQITAIAPLVNECKLWIAWPKQASGIVTDIKETEVRETALEAGLVDFKVCAIDATWSGLKFAARK